MGELAAAFEGNKPDPTGSIGSDRDRDILVEELVLARQDGV